MKRKFTWLDWILIQNIALLLGFTALAFGAYLHREDMHAGTRVIEWRPADPFEEIKYRLDKLFR